MNYQQLLHAPHLLIAGTTGSGKSVLLNEIIKAFLTEPTSPKSKLILIDPKRVELSRYKQSEYTADYTADERKTVVVLRRLIKLIERRYKWLARRGKVNLTGCHVYVIIDELADLLISDSGREIKRLLQKILQIGRAANVHIIAATQAPNRRVIPAEIVLNFTHRVALRCLTAIESRQIINTAGAETLPQYGKAYLLTPEGLTLEDVQIT